MQRGSLSSSEIPVLQGALSKKKVGLLGGVSWQKRWFRIEGDKLVYYKDREDLEHLGWIDMSESRVMRAPADEPDPFVFVLESSGRRYVLKASKKEHYNLWCDTLDKWTGKFKAEKQVSFISRQPSSISIPSLNGHSNNKSPRNSEDAGAGGAAGASGGGRDDQRGGAGGMGLTGNEVSLSPVDGMAPPAEGHAQALAQVQQILEKVKYQETLLNTAMKKVEKFKQKAFVLQELLEFKRDTVLDPARRINTLMKGYTSLERSIEDITRSMPNEGGGGIRAAGAQEMEVRMKLVVQRAETQLAQEKRNRRELEERLFRSEVMSMKLNELLSGRDVNWIDVNKLWAVCQREQVPSSEYASWVQQRIVTRPPEVAVQQQQEPAQ